MRTGTLRNSPKCESWSRPSFTAEQSPMQHTVNICQGSFANGYKAMIQHSIPLAEATTPAFTTWHFSTGTWTSIKDANAASFECLGPFFCKYLSLNNFRSSQWLVHGSNDDALLAFPVSRETNSPKISLIVACSGCCDELLPRLEHHRPVQWPNT